MPVTREAVIWAYRLFLGREPESEAAIVHKMGLKDVSMLRSAFLHSAEFGPNNPLIPVGLHLNVNVDPIVIDCTPELQKQMLDRIAVAWRKFGEEEPFWSVLTADQFRQREIGSSMEVFYESGKYQIDELCALLRRNAIDPTSLSRVMDFGCGVGRLSLALARRFTHVMGVDISPAHIRLARDRAKQIGVSNATFTALNDINSLIGLPDCDLLFSRIVLQHNPPPVIAAVLARLLDRVATGGCAVFQVPTFIQGYSFDPEIYLNSWQAQMEMNALPQRHIFALAAQKGFLPLEVRENLDVGDAGMVSQIFLFRRS